MFNKVIFNGLILFLANIFFTIAQLPTVTESFQNIPTFPFSDPDPSVSMNNIYPYFRYDGFTTEEVSRKWKIITLENQYIKVLIAPEIGGKVLGAFDKTTGKDFLYFNPVVKFRNIGMRGPWVSGGIEFNYGCIGHAPTSAFPVDYLTRKNDDGSVSCFLGAEDLPSRTYWVVEVELPPDKAYFVVRSRWINPTKQHTSLYQWMNGAVDATPDLDLVFPGRYHINHDGEAGLWPVDEQGREINIYANNNFYNSKSYHVLGAYSDFFGGYWERQDNGFGHISLYGERPGRKIWIWSLAQRGQIWIPLLTDTTKKGQYVEVQSGVLFNQAGERSTFSPFKHRMFHSHEEVVSTETWFPVKGMGGLTGATREMAFYMNREKSRLLFNYCPLERLSDTLYIRQNNDTIYQRFLTAEPLEPGKISLPLHANDDVAIFLSDELIFSKKDSLARLLKRPLSIPSDFRWNSMYGLYTKALERERQREYTRALEKYRECLEQEKYFIPALTGEARIYYRRLEYDTALNILEKALSIDAYNAETNYLYGLVQAAMGDNYNALDGFQISSRAISHAYASHIETAKIYLKNKEWDHAGTFAKKALNYKGDGMEALKILVLTYRQKNKVTEYQQMLDRILLLNPLDHFAGYEKYRQEPTRENLAFFQGSIHNEFPQETFLELAIFYYDRGFTEDAIRILDLAPDHPVVHYWLGWLYHLAQEEQEARQYLARALQSSPYLVFPYRPETLQPLLWAANTDHSWKTKYYLGLIYWHLDRNEKASYYFESCGDTPDYSFFYLTRSRVLKTQKDYDEERDLKRALTLDQNNWRAYWALIRHYNNIRKYELAIQYARKGVTRFKNNFLLQTQLARSYYNNHAYKKCLNELSKTHILPYENARYGRNLYRMAHISQALNYLRKGNCNMVFFHLDEARKYPLNLGTGEPYNPDTRIEDYIASICYRKSGNTQQADSLLNKIIDYTLTWQIKWNTSHFLGAIILRQQGREREAVQMLQKWVLKYPDNPTVQWTWSMWTNDTEKAAKITSSLQNSGEGTPWNPSGVDSNYKILIKLFQYHLMPDNL